MNNEEPNRIGIPDDSLDAAVERLTPKFDPAEYVENGATYIPRRTFQGCLDCEFQTAEHHCDMRPCCPENRTDGFNVIFIRKEVAPKL